jgi:hypothetical protein
VTADIAAGVAQDAANNANAIAPQFTRTYDSIGPTVSMSSVAPNPANTSPIPVTVTFTQPVTGFVDTAITTANALVQNFAGTGASYTFDLVPAGQGPVTADIAAGVAQDAANNANPIPPQFTPWIPPSLHTPHCFILTFVNSLPPHALVFHTAFAKMAVKFT